MKKFAQIIPYTCQKYTNVSTGDSLLLSQYTQTMKLVPIHRKGLIWQQHRNWLEGCNPFEEMGRCYIIKNLKTKQLYEWAFWGNFDGRARFGVPSRWVFCHPNWRKGNWLLLYQIII